MMVMTIFKPKTLENFEQILVSVLGSQEKTVLVEVRVFKNWAK